MFTPAQLRAARGLLDWTRANLAKASGLSQETIKNIEHGIYKPQDATIDTIIRTFAAHDVEFTESEGVRRTTDRIAVLRGKDGMVAFIDDIHQTALQPASLNGEKPICTCNIDDSKFKEHLGDYAELHLKRMSKIEGLEIKLLAIKEEESKFPGADYRVHRYLPEARSAVPFYVYGDKFAIINFNVKNPPQIIIIYSALVAQSYRDQFKLLWDAASSVPPAKSQRLKIT